MTFVRPSEQRVISLGASPDVTDDFAAIYAALNAGSVFSVKNSVEISFGSPGPGSYSFTAYNAAVEINFRNGGTPASPSTTLGIAAVNPDPTDPITDSTDPQASAAECSANGITSDNFEFGAQAINLSGVTRDDALLIDLFPDALSIYWRDTSGAPSAYRVPWGLAAGFHFSPFYEDYVDGAGGGNDIRIDGSCILGGRPYAAGIGTAGYWFQTNEAVNNLVRVGAGQVVSTGSFLWRTTASWWPALGMFKDGSAGYSGADDAFDVRGVPCPSRIQVVLGESNYEYLPVGIMKYFCLYKRSDPLVVKGVAGTDYVMSLDNNGVSPRAALHAHVRDGYDPLTPGVY